MKKKCFAVLIAVALAIGLCLPAGAEDLPPVYFTSELNEAQDTLTVSLYTDGLNWTAIDFGIKYNPAVLRLTAVREGAKIASARAKGYDFLSVWTEAGTANARGYCNIVAAVGDAGCRMTAYAGPIAVYTFAIEDLTKARAALDLCVASVVNASGKPLLDYTSYAPSEPPIPYRSETANLFRYGDLDRDGVSIFDAMMIQQYLIGMRDLNEMQQAAAKVSGDEELSIFDAMLIQQYLVGMRTSFPAEERS